MPRRFPLILACAVLAAAPCRAQAPGDAPTPPAALQTVAPDVYRLGSITIDRAAREVRFPAAVNLVEGPVEYLLVGNQGKTHESVLRTGVDPVQLHTAMLLLGVGKLTAKGGPIPDQTPPSAIDAGYLATAKLPAGSPVTLLVRWPSKEGGDPVVHGGESLVDNTKTKTPMSEGNWLYNGSYFSDGQFVAASDKSLVAVITDPAALVNNPRPGHEDESLWVAATKRLPAVGTAVEVVFRLPSAPAVPPTPSDP